MHLVPSPTLRHYFRCTCEVAHTHTKKSIIRLKFREKDTAIARIARTIIIAAAIAEIQDIESRGQRRSRR
jgi:hypothetical protein